jgi:hypothetical protein
LLDRQLTSASQRFDRLNAAKERARIDGGDGKWFEQRDERLRLDDAILAQWTKAIIFGPVASAARFRVPDDVEGWH